ncbi:MAG: PfkB family carbohydrate kinase, partial [Chloroflexota bacterium]
MLTGTSDDGVGRLVRRFLRAEGVSTDLMHLKPGRNTNAFLLSIQPPDTFEAAVYQMNSADLWLSVADVAAAPIAEAGALLFTGMGVLRPTNYAATLFAAEAAHAENIPVYMDIDYKGHQWDEDPREFGVFVRGLLRLVDVAVGTEDEICAAAGHDDLNAAVDVLLNLVRSAVVVKHGERGATAYIVDGRTFAAPVFPVEVLNVFGAGDAFAAGLIAARHRGAGWDMALRQAAASGALIVTRHGCANDMPTSDEVTAFLASQ